MMPKANVSKEYVVGGIEGYIDILADGEAWELKTGQANAYDVYQLFMYMDVDDIKNGFLVAKEFSGGAQEAIKHIAQKHDVTINDAALADFPINHPTTSQERDDYF